VPKEQQRQIAQMTEAAKDVEIPPAGGKILLDLFNSPRYVVVDDISVKLKLNIGLTQHYIDVLMQDDLIDDVAEESEK